MDWLRAVAENQSSNNSCVVVMITSVAGSAPRSVGTRMVVTLDNVYGTIGGGALELEGISHARALIENAAALKGDETLVSSRDFNLGKDLSQCCGGKVRLQFDCHFANDFLLHIFGAGHVGQELARLALRLPCRAEFHDTRPEWLARIDAIHGPEHHHPGQIATTLMGVNVHEHVEALHAKAYYLVMTHCHDLDLEVVEAVLSRGDAAYCGLIASARKAVSFRNRLKRKGFTDNEVQRLTAPLGQHVCTGNTPMEVAIAGISDILTTRERTKALSAESDQKVMT